VRPFEVVPLISWNDNLKLLHDISQHSMSESAT